MHLDSNVCMSNIITVGFSYFVIYFLPSDCFPSVHNHSCMFPNSMVTHAIFMQFLSIMNLTSTMRLAQE